MINKLRYLLVLFLLLCFSTAMGGKTFTLDRGTRIITGDNPSNSVHLAATELQYFIAKVTGIQIPIEKACASETDNLIFVGPSEYTDRHGFDKINFDEQEYIIDITSDRIVLIGNDTDPDSETIRDKGRSNNGFSPEEDRRKIDYRLATGDNNVVEHVTLPSIFDAQGTCYAVYDFIERFLGVRFYGPNPVNIVSTPIKKLKIGEKYIRRAPALKYRDGSLTFGWPLMKDQYINASDDMIQLYMRRMRMGGRRWAANHAFTGFQDRFLKPNPDRPEIFEESHPEYFAKGRDGGSLERQFCYTNADLVNQVAQDAIRYFEGKGTIAEQIALGDYFAIVPLDNASWCECDECRKRLALDKDNRLGDHFNNGTASHYIWNFVNEVAKKVKAVAPDKQLATLAYHVYAYFPENIKLEDNISVAPCLHTRNYWAPGMRRNEMTFYRKWIEESKVSGRDIFLWCYLGFPTERGVFTNFNVFPGFNAHSTGEQFHMYAADGVKGIFLCGLSEQLDFYLAMKIMDDPSLNTDDILHEFFNLYFGRAAEPMKNFYSKIESVYSNPTNYPHNVQNDEAQFHQTRDIAWGYLGTHEVMENLKVLITQAEDKAKSPEEIERVNSWKIGIWNYMQEGFDEYHKH